jgi:hypothetical protein
MIIWKESSVMLDFHVYISQYNDKYSTNFKWYFESIAHILLFRNVDMLCEVKYSILIFKLLSSAKILK